MSQQPPPPKPAKLKLRRRAAPSTQEPLTEAPTPKPPTKRPAQRTASPPKIPKTDKSDDDKTASITFEQLAEMLGDDVLSLNALFHAEAEAGSDAAAAADGK